jgi:phosphorylcholine metabolism protein LicD
MPNETRKEMEGLITLLGETIAKYEIPVDKAIERYFARVVHRYNAYQIEYFIRYGVFFNESKGLNT